MIFTIALFIFSAKALWDGSRPHWRSHDDMTKIYLDPAERYVTGSRFVAWHQRGGEASKCNCQGMCGYGRGGSEHLMLATNKNSGLHGCHWCGHGQYDPSKGNRDKIVYCYEHKCNDGFVSVCQENVLLSINHHSYSKSHRACTCAKAAGQWVRVQGNPADTTITHSEWQEYTHSITDTYSLSIETSVEAGFEVEGIGMSTSTSMTETFETAVEQSWNSGSSVDHTITCDSGSSKDNAWQYVIYLYDVLCAEDNRDNRFKSKEKYSNGCALTAYPVTGEGFICTAGASEPPCCGPGANPLGTNDRKICEDDFASWTGQCDGWDSRTRWTSIEDASNLCINYDDKCSDLLSSGLGAHLAACGAHCGNNAYANVFDPNTVFDRVNMLQCDRRPSWTNNLFKSFCRNQREGKHSVFMLKRNCRSAVWARRSSFDNAYKAAEDYWVSRGRDGRDYIPIYYNNWHGACDSVNGRRSLEDEDVFEFEHCKCDTECALWGDCCDHCKEAMEEMHDGEMMSQLEMEALGPLRATMTEEDYIKAKDDFEKDVFENERLV